MCSKLENQKKDTDSQTDERPNEDYEWRSHYLSCSSQLKTLNECETAVDHLLVIYLTTLSFIKLYRQTEDKNKKSSTSKSKCHSISGIRNLHGDAHSLHDGVHSLHDGVHSLHGGDVHGGLKKDILKCI